MPDVTISLTDAQWTRVVAASEYIKGMGASNITTTELAAIWKDQLTDWVKDSERKAASVDDF